MKRLLKDMELYGAHKEGQAFYNITTQVVEKELEEKGSFDIERLKGNIPFNELARLSIPNNWNKIVVAILDYEDETDCFENEKSDSRKRYAYQGISKAIEDLTKKYKSKISSEKDCKFTADSYYTMEILTLIK